MDMKITFVQVITAERESFYALKVVKHNGHEPKLANIQVQVYKYKYK